MLAARELLALVACANDARGRRAIQDDHEAVAGWDDSRLAAGVDPITYMGLFDSHGHQASSEEGASPPNGPVTDG